jgi:hypothetical protein
MLADTRQTNIPGISPDDVAAARANFQDTLIKYKLLNILLVVNLQT